MSFGHGNAAESREPTRKGYVIVRLAPESDHLFGKGLCLSTVEHKMAGAGDQPQDSRALKRVVEAASMADGLPHSLRRSFPVAKIGGDMGQEHKD